ncbi:MAG TPA: chorismate synthase [Oculatellaceae cyanobacterium]
MLRFLTCGESHGPTLFSLLDGVPAGLPIKLEEINDDLWRRQQGYGRGNRQKIEKDTAEIIGGVRHGITTGAPLGMLIRNRDFDNWRHVMSIEDVDRTDKEVLEQLEKKLIGKFRPGHADLAGTLKFRQKDIRDVLERASARETASRVAAGAVARQILNCLGISVASHVIQVGSVKSSQNAAGRSLAELDKAVLQSELFCADADATEKMKELIKETWQAGDSLGGVVEVLVDGLPVGLGSYTQWDRKIDGQLAQAVMSIQAMKAVEVGDGVAGAGTLGSGVHDALYPSNNGLPFSRKTNHAGGVEGGMTNGERLCVRAYMKPIPTMRNGLESVSFPGFEADRAHYERSDVCAIAAASVVCKAMVCLVLANAVLDKFGGDTLTDIRNAFNSYVEFCQAPDLDSGIESDAHEDISSNNMLEPTGSEDAVGEF